MTAILHKSLAYGNLIEECYRPGFWAEPYGEDGGWVRIDGPYWINPRWIQGIGRPRCSHCKRATHYGNSCPICREIMIKLKDLNMDRLSCFECKNLVIDISVLG
ncbi:hypothetical protein NITHO_6590001 [Nitrolancea hollandica Lb]|uniref:Uncharacterized protein n=1 Tax=Nitrolancea hollandica Lb TaxID=1129897 RepID=I4EMU4_9BACT|nr:hypothetical protein NITHO_6590001 [Nitrolancea hollandica Lb]